MCKGFSRGGALYDGRSEGPVGTPAAVFRTEVRGRNITDCQECGEPGREECGGRRDHVCGEVRWVERTLICGKTNRKPLCMDWAC